MPWELPRLHYFNTRNKNPASHGNLQVPNPQASTRRHPLRSKQSTYQRLLASGIWRPSAFANHSQISTSASVSIRHDHFHQHSVSMQDASVQEGRNSTPPGRHAPPQPDPGPCERNYWAIFVAVRNKQNYWRTWKKCCSEPGHSGIFLKTISFLDVEDSRILYMSVENSRLSVLGIAII